MSRGDAAGRGPQAKRGGPRDVRSRAPIPKRLSPREEPPPRQSTTLTARAAILAVSLATVIVAIALPFKVWLSQRDSINSLSAQNAAIAKQVTQLQKQDQRWQTPAYIEKQAQKRLQYVMPGTKTYIVLGTTKHKTSGSGAKANTVAADGPWYSTLWSSMQVAGGATSAKK